MDLASTLLEIDDPVAAQSVYDSAERSLSGAAPDDPRRVEIRHGIALATLERGDAAGACSQFEALLASARSATAPIDAEEVERLELNLAVARHANGNLDAAIETLRGLRARREDAPSLDPRDPLRLGLDLTGMLLEAGEVDEAERELSGMLEKCERRGLGDDDPIVRDLLSNLAIARKRHGDLAGARALEERALAAGRHKLPWDSRSLLRMQRNLAATCAALGDDARVAALGAEIVSVERRFLFESAPVSPRETSELVLRGQATSALLLALALRGGHDAAAIDRDAFELIETARTVAADDAAMHARLSADSRMVTLLADAARTRARVSDLVAAVDRTPTPLPAAADVVEAARERDGAQARLVAAARARGCTRTAIDLDALARKLGDDEAAIGYVVASLQHLERGVTAIDPGVERLLAHVVHGGRLELVDLGPAAPIRASIAAVRRSINERIRGARPADAAGRTTPLAAALRELRRELLDPLLARVGNATTLHLCLDDALHLLPLDALALDADGTRELFVGDKYRVLYESSFSRLLAPRAVVERSPFLLAMGGVDFDADPAAAHGAPPSGPGDTPRQGPGGRIFVDLSDSLGEAQSVQHRFQTGLLAAEDPEASTLLVRADATKAAFLALAPRATVLHLATHGYFAPDALTSASELGGAQDSTLAEAVEGLAPLALCGLAFAGANRGCDVAGHVPGVLTAEELAGVDLSGCSLAVLSACDTGAGIPIAGQGVNSLQSALHAAGARTVVVSLWRAFDQSARVLMDRFYANLWTRGAARVPKSQALWRAKRALHDSGAAWEEWAGFVLSGDPD